MERLLLEWGKCGHIKIGLIDTVTKTRKFLQVLIEETTSTVPDIAGHRSLDFRFFKFTKARAAS